VIVNVTVPPGAIVRTTPEGKPVALAGVAVVPVPVVAVVQPPSATICGGTGSVKVAWAVVNALVLPTTTVYVMPPPCVGVVGSRVLVMVSGAVPGVDVNESSPLQGGWPSVHAVPGFGVTDPTLTTVTVVSLGRMVTVIANVTVPVGATVIGTPLGDPVPVEDPHVDPVLGVHVQVAPAASSGGSGSASENVPEAVALLPGLVTVTV
jgi:hypothetical protein